MFNAKKILAKISSAAKAVIKKIKVLVPRVSTQAAAAPPIYGVLFHSQEDDVDPLPVYVRDAHEDTHNHVPAYDPSYTDQFRLQESNATFPDARPSPRSAQVEAEHARIFAPRELKPFVAAPPLQLGFGFGLPLAGAEYAYPDPGESWAFYAPQVQPQSSAGPGDNAGYCEDGGEQQQHSAAPRLALTMAPMAGAMALSRAHYADAHAQSPVSPVPASAVSSTSTSFASPVSSSFAGSPSSAPSSFDTASFDTNTTINTDININSIDINTNCTANDGYDEGSPPPSAVSSYADSLSHSPTEYVPMASLPPPPYAYPPYPQAYTHPHLQPIPPHSHLHPLPLAPHFPHLQAPPPLPYLPPHTHALPSHSMDMRPPHLPQPPHLTTAQAASTDTSFTFSSPFSGLSGISDPFSTPASTPANSDETATPTSCDASATPTDSGGSATPTCSGASSHTSATPTGSGASVTPTGSDASRDLLRNGARCVEVYFVRDRTAPKLRCEHIPPSERPNPKARFESAGPAPSPQGH
ncbi:hypothetical protein C8R47DRAFT_1066013 [Mycena vitilis]|nr:hypothetical protein C8R47DRAFT_1066013 [Mycena vitilis]